MPKENKKQSMISQEEYRQRRLRLAKSLEPGSLALIAAADERLRNGDACYRFRQDSHFSYLTGFNEPEALLLILAEGESYLFNRASEPLAEIWTGKRLGQAQAPEILGVKEAFDIEGLSDLLPEFLANKTALYYCFGRNPWLEKELQKALNTLRSRVRQGVGMPTSLCDLEGLLSEARLIKSEAEIEVMRQAIAISISGHKKAMQRCKSLSYEYELEAELAYEFYRQGARAMAYDPIVASGGNACTLHYNDNNQELKSGDLVLIDAGAEYANYAADITRCFPVSGSFNSAQKAIYNLVLEAQKAAIALIKPGIAWSLIQEKILEILTSGLCDLGILQGKVDELIANGAYKPFYMHNSGHWLGLDVHDCGAYKLQKKWRELQSGMVLTVEPGLYIPAIATIDEAWWHIGVRIEDDILVTPEGHENLSAALPVDIDEIEALMRD